MKPLARGSLLAGSIFAAAGFGTRLDAAQPPPPLSALDKIAIMELAARFETALDREDVDAYLATFAPAGELDGFGVRARGTVQLRDAFFTMLANGARGRRHCSMNQIITGGADAARMVSYLVVFDRNDLFRAGSAIVTDDAIRRNGTWYLSRRKIDVDPSFGSGPAPKATP